MSSCRLSYTCQVWPWRGIVVDKIVAVRRTIKHLPIRVLDVLEYVCTSQEGATEIAGLDIDGPIENVTVDIVGLIIAEPDRQ